MRRGGGEGGKDDVSCVAIGRVCSSCRSGYGWGASRTLARAVMCLPRCEWIGRVGVGQEQRGVSQVSSSRAVRLSVKQAVNQGLAVLEERPDSG